MRACLFVWNTFVNDARVFKEAASLAEAGWQVCVICLQDADRPTLPYEATLAGFTVKRLKRAPLKHTVYRRPWIFLRMLRAGLRENADVYHSNDLNTLPQGWLCAKVFRRRKLIYDSHEVQSSRTGYGRWHRLFERFLIRRADRMLMTTDMRADYVAERYGIPKPTVIRNLPQLREADPAKGDLRALLSLPPEEPILLYQGGVQAGRGIEQLIDAMPSIRRGTLVIIGAGRLYEAMRQRARERGLDDRIRFLPTVPYAELHHYTAHAYLGFQVIQNICFNHVSTISNKLLEYITGGVPVVASDFPEIKRIVEGYGVGLCIDPHDPANIAAAANRLLEEAEFHARCREACLAARSELSWDNEKPKFVDIFNLELCSADR